MPVIRVEVPKPTPEDVQRRIRSAIKQAVLAALAPKETQYDYVAVREVIGEVGDGAPLVTVDLRPGREPARTCSTDSAIVPSPMSVQIVSVPVSIDALRRQAQQQFGDFVKAKGQSTSESSATSASKFPSVQLTLAVRPKYALDPSAPRGQTFRRRGWW